MASFIPDADEADLAYKQVGFGDADGKLTGNATLTYHGGQLTMTGATQRVLKLLDTGGTSDSQVLVQTGAQGENAVIEMGSEDGAFIDMKDPNSTDFNLRVSHQNDLSKILTNSPLEISNVGGGGNDDISVISKRNTYLTQDGTLIINDDVADTSVGPVVELRKNDASASYGGSLRWLGKNDAGNLFDHYNIFTQCSDKSAGNEDTKVYHRIESNGNLVDAIQIVGNSALGKIGINKHPAYPLDIQAVNEDNPGIRITTSQTEDDYIILSPDEIEMKNAATGGDNATFEIKTTESQGVQIRSPSGDWIFIRDSSARNLAIFKSAEVVLGSSSVPITIDGTISVNDGRYINKKEQVTLITGDTILDRDGCRNQLYVNDTGSTHTITLPGAGQVGDTLKIMESSGDIRVNLATATDYINGVENGDVTRGVAFDLNHIVCYKVAGGDSYWGVSNA